MNTVPEIIEDPDCEGFDGRYVVSVPDAPYAEYDYSGIARYMKLNNKAFQELTKDELEQFRFK